MSAETRIAEKEVAIAAQQEADFTPVRMVEIELGQALPALSAVDEVRGQSYRRARCLVRLHTHPLGEVEIPFDGSEVLASEYAGQIWQEVGAQINEHLQRDGLPAVAGLDEMGLPASTTPRCLEERAQFLANAPFVSVIVPTHERPERLRNCLNCLLAQHYPRYEIIIVDNAPITTATADLVWQNYQDDRVCYIREDQPGIPRARNRGITAARGTILAFTDDDVVIDTFWLAELVQAFQASDGVVCVTGHVLSAELETPAQAWLEQYGGFSKGFTRRIFDLVGNRLDHPLYPYVPGRLGTGANMAFRADYLRATGGFATELENQGSDVEALFQVIMRSYKLVYEPAAIVRHFHHRSYESLRRQIYRYGVGLTAFLTKTVIDRPRLLPDLVSKLAYGLFFILSKRSSKNSKKRADYPHELTSSELKGMLYGPVFYLNRRWAMGQNRGLLPR